MILNKIDIHLYIRTDIVPEILARAQLEEDTIPRDRAVYIKSILKMWKIWRTFPWTTKSNYASSIDCSFCWKIFELLDFLTWSSWALESSTGGFPLDVILKPTIIAWSIKLQRNYETFKIVQKKLPPIFYISRIYSTNLYVYIDNNDGFHLLTVTQSVSVISLSRESLYFVSRDLSHVTGVRNHDCKWDKMSQNRRITR